MVCMCLKGMQRICDVYVSVCVCVCVCVCGWGHGVSMCVELRHFKYKWRSKGVCVFVGQRDGGVSEGDTE